MKCIWLENGHVLLKQAERPGPSPGNALIKIQLAGICGTDLQLRQGYYEFVGAPGHEFVGEVMEAPDDPVWVGKRVVADINFTCGNCQYCIANDPHHCLQRQALGITSQTGAFAEYCEIPLQNLYEVPQNVSAEQAVFAEPLAAAAHVLDTASFTAEDNVLLIGAGKLGLLIAQVIATTECRFQVVVRYEKQNQLLRQWGIRFVEEVDVRESAYSSVIEATGSGSGFALALKAVKARGSVVLKSTYKGDLKFNASKVVVDEINIRGSRCGSMQQALDLLSSQMVDPLPLIESRYPLDQAAQAFDYAAGKGVLKVLLQM